MEEIFKFIARCGLQRKPHEINFRKTELGNWAVYTGNACEGIFIPKDLLSEENVKKHNKKYASKK